MGDWNNNSWTRKVSNQPALSELSTLALACVFSVLLHQNTKKHPNLYLYLYPHHQHHANTTIINHCTMCPTGSHKITLSIPYSGIRLTRCHTHIHTHTRTPIRIRIRCRPNCICKMTYLKTRNTLIAARTSTSGHAGQVAPVSCITPFPF